MKRLCLLATSASCLLACGDDESPDQQPTPTIEWSIDTQEVAEGGRIHLQLRPRAIPSEPFVVRYATTDGTATAGADYTAAQGELRWEPGERDARTITIETAADLAFEGAEQLTLTLADALPTPVLSLDHPIELTITDGNRVGDAFVLTSLNRLVSFDRAAPDRLTHVTAITDLAEGEQLVGLDVRPRDATLVALGQSGRIYTVDPATGQARRISRLSFLVPPFEGLPGDHFSVDFDASRDRLTLISHQDAFTFAYSIDVATGQHTQTVYPSEFSGIAYDQNVRAACRTGLYAIDPAADRLMFRHTPDDGFVAVGPLGLDAETYELDLETTDAGQSRAFALSSLRGRAHVLTLDLTTGRATDAGALPLDTAERAVAFALRPGNAGRDVSQRPGRLLAVTQDHQLITLEPESLRPCTSAPITGLGAYQIMGIDFRPATGKLYAFARIGALSSVLRLSSSGAVEHIAPLSYLSGATSWGVNFDPVTSDLRLVNNEGQNVRVTDVETGDFIEDAPLSGDSPRAFAASYSDSLHGAAASTLYTIDPQTSQLMRLSDPADGHQLRLQHLSSNIERVTGFEIDGRDHQAVLAFEPTAGFETQIATLDLRQSRGPTIRSTWPNQRFRGLTLAPPTASVYALLADQQLVELSLATPTTPRPIGAIRGLAAGEELLALTALPADPRVGPPSAPPAPRPHQRAAQTLVAVSNRGVLYTVDPATALASRLSQLVADPGDATLPYQGLSGLPIGLTFSATTAELWITEHLPSGGGFRTLRVTDLTTGNTHTDSLNVFEKRSSFQLLGLAVPPTTASDQNRLAFDKACRCLVSLTPDGVITDLTPYGSFDVDFQAPLDFAPDGTAFGIRNAFPTITGPVFFQIDRTTGAMTILGSIRAPQSPSYLHLAIAPDGMAYAMDRFGQLFRFSPTAPDQASYLGSSTLGTGERVTAIDFHPTTGQLWMLTRDSSAATLDRLYTVELGDATATFRAGLTADPADRSDPYLVLPIDRPDMDFDPTSGALLISGHSRLYRLPDPTTGLVVTDGNVRYLAPHVAAAAFRNRLDFFQRSSLLLLDVADRAAYSAAPLDQTSRLGAFGLSLGTSGAVSNVASLALAGGTDGLALAALQRTGLAEPFSRLYRINPDTGRLSELGAIGTGAATRSVAILLRD